MRTRSLSQQYQRLSWLIAEAKKLDADQIELQSHWARYLCVLSSGFLENSLKEVYSSYARSRCDPQIANYIEASLSRIQNPKSSKFIETARSFDASWADNLEAFLEENGNKDAIDGIMSNRHLIAHGKDSGITLVRIKDYIDKSVKVIEFIEVQCGI